MHLLILGGTGLTGTAISHAALDAGHHVTIVHRGRSESAVELMQRPGVTSVVLDRRNGHAPLGAGEWDAVIDVSGYLPPIVRDGIGHLAREGRPYVYISTCSVYADNDIPDRDETARLVSIGDEDLRMSALTDVDFDWAANGVYGECKALCERELEVAWPGPVALLRPVIIAGAHDSTWRVAYWADRALRGGEMIAPDPRTVRVGLVDVRDLAEFALHCATRGIAGTFNIAADREVATFEGLVASAIDAAETPCGVAWVTSEFLEAAEVEPHTELPFWLPESTCDMHVFDLDTTAAVNAGFTTRPLVDTMREVCRWLGETDAEHLPVPGRTLTPDREAELLVAARAAGAVSVD